MFQILIEKTDELSRHLLNRQPEWESFLGKSTAPPARDSEAILKYTILNLTTLVKWSACRVNVACCGKRKSVFREHAEQISGVTEGCNKDMGRVSGGPQHPNNCSLHIPHQK